MYTKIVFFTVFLKNRNIISKIKISKVTDYAAFSLSSGPVELYFQFYNYYKDKYMLLYYFPMSVKTVYMLVYVCSQHILLFF